MATHYLEPDLGSDFLLAGIGCHERDFRLAWDINRTLSWNLVRANDISVIQRDGKSLHSSFVYGNDDEKITYTLLTNKTPEGILQPELAHFDFLLKIENTEQMPTGLLKELRRVRLVSAIYEIEVETLRMKHYLVTN